MTTRGIAQEESQNFLDIYNERLPLYSKYAEKTIHCGKKGIEEIVKQIIYGDL